MPPGAQITIRTGRQSVSVPRGLAGRTITIWADQRSVHLILDGEVLRTVASRLSSARSLLRTAFASLDGDGDA